MKSGSTWKWKEGQCGCSFTKEKQSGGGEMRPERQAGAGVSRALGAMLRILDFSVKVMQNHRMIQMRDLCHPICVFPRTHCSAEIRLGGGKNKCGESAGELWDRSWQDSWRLGWWPGQWRKDSLISYSARGQKSKVKLWAGLAPSKASRRFLLSPPLSQVPVAAGAPGWWLCPSTLCLRGPMVLPRVDQDVLSSSYEDTSP